MTAPDTRDSVERIVAEMRNPPGRALTHLEYMAWILTWADRLSALPQQAVGDGLKELRRKANCWDSLQEARSRAKEESPQNLKWKGLARQGQVMAAVKECRAELGCGLMEAKDCVEGFIAQLRSDPPPAASDGEGE